MVKNLAGQRFGRLIALKENGRTSNKKAKWDCLCDCGNICNVSSHHLVNGHTKSCGCIVKERAQNNKRANNFKDRSGQKFNRLTFVEYKGDKKWLLICDCGNTIITKATAVTSGRTKSCGCLRKEPKIVNKIGFKANGCEVVGMKKRENGTVMWQIECDRGHSFYAGDKAVNHLGLMCNKCEKYIKIKNEDREHVILNREYMRNVRARHKLKGGTDKTIISFEEYKKLVKQPCYYCGQKFSRVLKDIEHTRKIQVTDVEVKINGLDRIDSKKGYEIDNVVPCCKRCNTMKLDQEQSEFFNKIKLIYEKHLK